MLGEQAGVQRHRVELPEQAMHGVRMRAMVVLRERAMVEP